MTSQDTSSQMAGTVFKGLKRFGQMALLGLGVSVLMGVFFGLVIGIGGALMGIETEQLLLLGGFSGWISSGIAIFTVFAWMRRQKVQDAGGSATLR